MNLMIEVTRKCNMTCEHCLRGCAENVNIRNEYITSMLQQVKKLGYNFNVTFTGGEPSLNLNAIKHYINVCNELDIKHDFFYIATNGTNNNDKEFIMTLLELYVLAEDKELCRVDISNDIFHMKLNDDITSDYDLIRGLAFVGTKFTSDYHDYNNYKSIVSEGNGQGFGIDNIRDIVNFENSYCDDYEEFINDGTEIYLNAHGEIVLGCDWSYNTQDTNEDVYLCNVNDFEKTVKSNIMKYCEV